jgi:hypothetical protein
MRLQLENLTVLRDGKLGKIRVDGGARCDGVVGSQGRGILYRDWRVARRRRMRMGEKPFVPPREGTIHRDVVRTITVRTHDMASAGPFLSQRILHKDGVAGGKARRRPCTPPMTASVHLMGGLIGMRRRTVKGGVRTRQSRQARAKTSAEEKLRRRKPIGVWRITKRQHGFMIISACLDTLLQDPLAILNRGLRQPVGLGVVRATDAMLNVPVPAKVLKATGGKLGSTVGPDNVGVAPQTEPFLQAAVRGSRRGSLHAMHKGEPRETIDHNKVKFAAVLEIIQSDFLEWALRQSSRRQWRSRLARLILPAGVTTPYLILDILPHVGPIIKLLGQKLSLNHAGV